MNYRHAYHAGNHADVLKHAILACLIERLKKKEKPFRVIDAHAGTGCYDLASAEATKTLEWRGGIGRLADPFGDDVEALLAPYRAVIATLNEGGNGSLYPGSPWLAARLCRPGERIIANELHPLDRKLLEDRFSGDRRVTVTGIDALACVKANLPPPERRGVVLIDPPYEAKDEATRALAMVREGLERFATGCFVLWYPLKADQLAEDLLAAAAALPDVPILCIELQIRERFAAGGLAGSGLVIVNPPWQLDQDARVVAPALAQRLGLGNWGRASVDWLRPPR
jgi:23S rRNA (adenine2030-N6)-methyltransferase